MGDLEDRLPDYSSSAARRLMDGLDPLGLTIPAEGRGPEHPKLER